MRLAPCRASCPLRVNIQGYVQSIARGRIDQARAIVREKLPFLGIIGRVCTHPCESTCERNKVDGQAVAIRALKRFLDDTEGKDELDFSVPPSNGHRVAIVGSGPAGMMAAWDLRKLGYQVVMYEAAPIPGGLLSWAIPRFRLPRTVIEREFSYLPRVGVDVRLNTRVGQDISFEELYQSYDAVFLAVGAQGPRRLGLDGEDAEGIVTGMEFLREVENSDGSLKIGSQVLVIGGGNVAIDAALTALRVGGRSVRVVCLEDQDNMPAFAGEIQEAHAEGIDLVHSLGPSRFIVVNGHVRGVEFSRCTQIFDSVGSFSPCLDRSDTCVYDADTVIVAIGQEPDVRLVRSVGVEIAGSQIRVDPVTRQTSLGNVFAGGDIINGPCSVVDAMADGKEAAASIHRLLTGNSLTYGRDESFSTISDFEIDYSKGSTKPRVVLPENELAGPDNFRELEGDITLEEAQCEASRCLSCGAPEGYYRSCWYCLSCEVACPEDAIVAGVPYLVR